MQSFLIHNDLKHKDVLIRMQDVPFINQFINEIEKYLLQF